jgi:hypothetical protein
LLPALGLGRPTVYADPTRSATIGKFMVGIYGSEGPTIATGYPFGRFHTLIDIGGGQGHCNVVVGDFFHAVPAGYDAYVIKSVLHNWDDGKAVEILHQCRDAMPRHSRVLVIEIVVSPGQPLGHQHPMIDLEMMVSFGGKERTEHKFAPLLRSVGLTLEKVTPTHNSFISVVEATLI